jgi:hypothetical protein
MTTESVYELESFAAIQKRLGWRFYAGILLYAALVIPPMLYWAPTYYWSVLSAGAAIGFVLIRFWAFSKRTWFWTAIVTATLLQIPIVIATHGIATRYKGSFALFFMLIDFMCIDIALRKISPELRAIREGRG